jgi:hypothetical protein
MIDKTATSGYKHHRKIIDSIDHTICAVKGTGINSSEAATNQVNSSRVSKEWRLYCPFKVRNQIQR